MFGKIRRYKNRIGFSKLLQKALYLRSRRSFLVFNKKREKKLLKNK